MPPKLTSEVSITQQKESKSTTSKSTFFLSLSESAEKKELIYSSTRFSKTFNFYMNEAGRVSVGYICDDQEERFLLIDGLPKFESAIEDRKTALRQILQESYFTVLGHNVQINGRLKGGWGNEVHRGIYSQGDTAFIDGTCRWAEELGFPTSHPHTAIKIAEANVEIDKVLSSRSYMPLISDQSWHFNVTSKLSHPSLKDGDELDTRIGHAVEKLREAILAYNSAGTFTDAVSTALGNGLHPLQDVFAHTEYFVDYGDDDGEKRYWAGHISEKGAHADDPKFYEAEASSKDSPKSFCDQPITVTDESGSRTIEFNQRYSDTKTATYLYLILFLHATKLIDQAPFKKPVEVISRIMVDVEHARINDSNFDKFVGLLKRVQKEKIMSSLPSVAELILGAAEWKASKCVLL